PEPLRRSPLLVCVRRELVPSPGRVHLQLHLLAPEPTEEVVMKAIRPAGAFLLVLTLAVCLSSCSKKEEATTTFSQDSLSTTAMGADPLPSDGVTVPTAEHTPEPPATTHAKSKPKPSPPPTAAEKRTVSLPTGATFIAEMVTPINTGTSNVGDKI